LQAWFAMLLWGGCMLVVVHVILQKRVAGIASDAIVGMVPDGSSLSSCADELLFDLSEAADVLSCIAMCSLT